jgi:hypothetical protein
MFDAVELSAPPRFSAVGASLSVGSFAPPFVVKTSELGGAGRMPAARAEGRLAALPDKPGVIFEDVGKKFCIGGTVCPTHCATEAGGCEVRSAYVIKLDRPAYLSAIQVYAHDEVGVSRRASLLVKVNGEPVDKIPVYRYGSTLSVKIGRIGQLVTIESMHDTHGFLNGGDESVIWDIYLLGREPR